MTRPYEKIDNPPGFYAAFVTSMELRRAGETLVWEVEHDNWRQHDALIEVITRFNDESAQAYILNTLAAMGISGAAARFAETTLATLSVTINRLSRQIVPKLDRSQLEMAAAHVRSLSLTLPDADGQLQALAGFIVPDYLEDMRRDIVTQVRAGAGDSQRPRIRKLLSELGDLMLEEIYLKSIRLMGFGFLTDKLIQGGLMVARTVQHQLIHWVVSTLDEQEFRQMADYTEKLIICLPEASPHQFLFYPND